MDSTPPQHLPWVKVRAECTPSRILKQLRDEVLVDIATRAEYLTESQKQGRVGFELRDEATTSFVVWRDDGGTSTGVTIGISGTEIVAIDNRGNVFLRATLGLNDNGRCMLRIGTVDLETWQFRKKALEDLLFWR